MLPENAFCMAGAEILGKVQTLQGGKSKVKKGPNRVIKKTHREKLPIKGRKTHSLHIVFFTFQGRGCAYYYPTLNAPMGTGDE